MKITSLARLAALLLALFALCAEVHAQTLLRDGTWTLSKRVLPDGTVLVPPAVHGRSSTKEGANQLLVFWHTPEGKQASLSTLTKWSHTPAEMTATLILMIFDDGSGKPPMYDLSGRSSTVPLTRVGNKFRYQHPLNAPMIETDGEKMTAKVEGVFTDHWERLR